MSISLRKEKPAIVFYGSNIDVLSLFTEEEQQELVLRIMEYGFDGLHAEPDDEFDMILQPIFDGIRVQKNRHDNIAFINEFIAKINRNTVDLIDKETTSRVGKAIAMLKQEIAICQDSDIDPAEVQAHIITIMNNPAIWAVVRNRNNPNNAYYPKTDYAARYAGQQVR